MKKYSIISIVFAFTFYCTQSLAQSGTDVIASKFDKSGKGAGYTLPTIDVEAQKPAPTRGTCCINFDNYTGYILYVWVDSVYKGSVNSWEEELLCSPQSSEWYARTAGSTYEWSGYCSCHGVFNLTID